VPALGSIKSLYIRAALRLLQRAIDFKLKVGEISTRIRKWAVMWTIIVLELRAFSAIGDAIRDVLHPRMPHRIRGGRKIE
jgi:hypothetical protein